MRGVLCYTQCLLSKVFVMRTLSKLFLVSATLSGCFLFIPFGLECGDGVEEVNEECEDQNSVDGDGCDSNCTRTACNNNILTAGEVCDDGDEEGGFCASDCSRIETCGDGTLDNTEVCDDGNEDSGDGCRSDCLKEEVCGDGEEDEGEACDDGNTIDGDGCAGDCLRLENCGDGILDANELCDDGNIIDGDGCGGQCNNIEFCGDGDIDDTIGEQCDDANNLPDDGCTPDCQDELQALTETEANNTNLTANGLITGSLTVSADITSDSGNGRDIDFFALEMFVTTDLKIDVLPINPTSCNNRVRLTLLEEDLTEIVSLTNNGPNQCPAINNSSDQLPAGVYFLEIEELNAGNASADLDYRIVITVESLCSDGTTSSTEACDDGRQCDDGADCLSHFDCVGVGGGLCQSRDNDGCRADCRGLEVCGDGVIDAQIGEVCDDDDATSGDGCSSGCQVEAGFTCVGEPSFCDNICGDGLIVAGEACDDDDLTSGDGCSSGCAEEAGFNCTGEPSTCVTTCGDNIQAGAEACDGTDLNGATCGSINAATPNGTLSCNANCDFDTSLCLP